MLRRKKSTYLLGLDSFARSRDVIQAESRHVFLAHTQEHTSSRTRGGNLDILGVVFSIGFSLSFKKK